MSILIMVLIIRMIIFKLKYKVLGIRTRPIPNGFMSKIPKIKWVFGFIKLSPNPVVFSHVKKKSYDLFFS